MRVVQVNLHMNISEVNNVHFHILSSLNGMEIGKTKETKYLRITL